MKAEEKKKKGIRKINWEYVKEPKFYGLYRFTFKKTKKMEKYEKETTNRSVYKVIKKPIGKSLIGEVQLTSKYLEWEKTLK